MNQALTQVVYLEQYIESTYFVPTELSRLLNTIRALDERCINLSKDLQENTESLLAMPPAHLSTQPSEEYMQLIMKVDTDQRMLTQFCEEKLQVAQQSYEFLEMHALELERTMDNFESDLRVTGGLALDTTDLGINTALDSLAEMYTPGGVGLDPRGRIPWMEEGGPSTFAPTDALSCLPLPGLPSQAPLTGMLAALQPQPLPFTATAAVADLLQALAMPNMQRDVKREDSGGAGPGEDRVPSPAAAPQQAFAAPVAAGAPGLKRATSALPSRPSLTTVLSASAHASPPPPAPAPVSPTATAGPPSKRARTIEPTPPLDPQGVIAPPPPPLTRAVSPQVDKAVAAPMPPSALGAGTPGLATRISIMPGLGSSAKKRGLAGVPGDEGVNSLHMQPAMGVGFINKPAPGLKASASKPQVPGRLLGPSDIGPVLRGKHAELYWPDDASWYLIEIQDVDIPTRCARIMYTTGEVENLNLEEIAKDQHMSILANQADSTAQ